MATYLIAQHVPDLFRREERNVGVIVIRDGAWVAKFIGETGPGEFDGRKLRRFSHPHVYQQWVEYWRSLLARPQQARDEMLRCSGKHYRVVEGGELSDIGEDSLEDVANYLYSLLVSEGGFAEAVGGREEAEAAIGRLRDEISEDLARAHILLEGPEPNLLTPPHPVRRNYPVRGTAPEPHRPAFVQRNGLLYVMETVDFTARNREGAKDHAGWAAYMFDDIREATGESGVHPISIVRLRPEDEEDERVRYGMALLRNESHVFNWLDAGERERFVQSRIDASR